MGKKLYITEKPSVAQEFIKALHITGTRNNGYVESDDSIVTWCVGHLVRMSYPEAYDKKYKKWDRADLPFIPNEYKYEVIPAASTQYKVVKTLLTRADIDMIYICTDSGIEGQNIYYLVDMKAKVKCKNKKRVWIDSQTEEEIQRGVCEAKADTYYNNLTQAGLLRQKEDYLMGINFSRVLTLHYGSLIAAELGIKYATISVGRVMSCVLGMVVRREIDIRNFLKTDYYKIIANDGVIEIEWKAIEGSQYYENESVLYKDNGFRKKEDAEHFVDYLSSDKPIQGVIENYSKQNENKNAPLLYNLAELQNDCSKLFKISPDQTLKVVQQLYESKLTTYPRTDARVLSTAIAKEISKNLNGLKNYDYCRSIASSIIDSATYKSIGSSKYTDDSKITDHYAIIPTGQGFSNLNKLSELEQNIYNLIVKRFLSIFLPAAVYCKFTISIKVKEELFQTSFKMLISSGYLEIYNQKIDNEADDTLYLYLDRLKKGMKLTINSINIKPGETSPPKRYSSGSLILAMENAGQLIEDATLREQIKGSGIGTSATRSEILNKLYQNHYIDLNKKTQIITPAIEGELVYCVLENSIPALLKPSLTASWGKGLSYVEQGTVKPEDYLIKLTDFIRSKTQHTFESSMAKEIKQEFKIIRDYY